MTERATETRLRRDAAALAYTLGGHGWERAGLIRVRSPYGMVRYVVTESPDNAARVEHDVPGFEGSGGSGFVSIRDGIERIGQARRTMFEWARVAGFRFDHVAAAAARDAVLAAYGLPLD